MKVSSFKAGGIPHSEAPCAARSRDGFGCTKKRIIQSAAVPIVLLRDARHKRLATPIVSTAMVVLSLPSATDS
jgi:hypothetical protein